MREKLKKARTEAGMSQKDIAEQLGISERYYRMIETGGRNGDFEIWDALEDIFGIHQRRLREITTDKRIERNIE